jgi:hypothetical protein
MSIMSSSILTNCSNLAAGYSSNALPYPIIIIRDRLCSNRSESQLTVLSKNLSAIVKAIKARLTLASHDLLQWKVIEEAL